jgi:hypothetical protein
MVVVVVGPQIREQILDLEDRIPYQLLLNRVAYAKKRPAWRKVQHNSITDYLRSFLLATTRIP